LLQEPEAGENMAQETKRLSSTTVSLDIPSQADIGSPVSWSVKATLQTDVNWPNLATSIVYHDGPTDSVTVVMDSNTIRVPKGFTAYVVYKDRPSKGDTIEARGKVVLDREGTYIFRGVAGYIDASRGVFFVDSYDEKSVAAKTPTVTSPGGQQIPWIPIALAGAAAALIAVIGVVAYQEMKREELMMLMMLR